MLGFGRVLGTHAAGILSPLAFPSPVQHHQHALVRHESLPKAANSPKQSSAERRIQRSWLSGLLSRQTYLSRPCGGTGALTTQLSFFAKQRARNELRASGQGLPES